MATVQPSPATPEVRLYESCDAPELDTLLACNRGHDVRLDRDRIAVLGRPSRGFLVWRPGGIVHELRVGDSLGQRHAAHLLVEFGIGDSLSRPFHLHEAVFLCDSDAMVRYVAGLGAVEQAGRRVFTLDLRRQQ